MGGFYAHLLFSALQTFRAFFVLLTSTLNDVINHRRLSKETERPASTWLQQQDIYTVSIRVHQLRILRINGHNYDVMAVRHKRFWLVRFEKVSKFKFFAPKATTFFSHYIISIAFMDKRQGEVIMKSAKGKTPVGGKSKRVTVAHGNKKQKEKDPVEVILHVVIHIRLCHSFLSRFRSTAECVLSEKTRVSRVCLSSNTIDSK